MGYDCSNSPGGGASGAAGLGWHGASLIDRTSLCAKQFRMQKTSRVPVQSFSAARAPEHEPRLWGPRPWEALAQGAGGAGCSARPRR